MDKGRTVPVDLTRVVSRDPEVHSGDLVFAGTRVPVDTLIDYIKAGEWSSSPVRTAPSMRRRTDSISSCWKIPSWMRWMGFWKESIRRLSWRSSLSLRSAQRPRDDYQVAAGGEPSGGAAGSSASRR